MLVMIDLDGVICSEERTFERSLAEPMEGARQALATLKSMGHTVVIYSARSWAEYKMTFDWLSRHGFEFDSLVMGKPNYDVFIDDRAVRFEGWPSCLERLSAALTK